MVKKSQRNIHRRKKRRGPSKWVKNTNAIKYYKLKRRTSIQPGSVNRGSAKYQLVPRSKPRGYKIAPRQQIRVTTSYLVWAIIWIVVPSTIIGIASLPATPIIEPFSVVVSTGDYATYKVTIQEGDEAEEYWEVNYYKYLVMSVEEHEDTNSYLIRFNVYNSTDLVFNSTPRAQMLNLTNTILDVSTQMSMGGGRMQGIMGGSGGFPSGEFPSGELPSGEPPSGVQSPSAFSSGGFRGGTTISQILVPEEFDFTEYQDDIEEQYSEMSSIISSLSSDEDFSDSSKTVTIETSTKKIQAIMYSSESIISMDQYSEYSLKGLLIKQSSYSVREDFQSGENVETLTTTVLMASYTTVFY